MLALRRQLVLLGRVLVSRVELALRARPGLLVQALRLRAVLLQRTAQRPCLRVHALQRVSVLQALVGLRLPAEPPEHLRTVQPPERAAPHRAQQRVPLLLRREQARSLPPRQHVQLQLLLLVQAWVHVLELWEQLLVQHPVRPRLLRAAPPRELQLRLHRLPRLLQQELGRPVALPRMATCQEALPPQQLVALRLRPPAAPSVRERLLVLLQRKKRTRRSVAR